MQTNRRRRSWTIEEKRDLVKEARSRLAHGECWSSISERLGVLEGSLRLWLRQLPERTLQPVEVVEEVRPSGAAGLVLTMPSGVRLEGLDLATAARLLEVLR